MLPSDIVTREQILKVLAGGLKKASEPGLDKLEMMCLKVLIDASKTYDSVLEKFEKWVDIENRLLELDESGCTYEQIAEDLPARSMGSVRAKLQRLKREDCEDTYIGGRGVRAHRGVAGSPADLGRSHSRVVG